MCNTFVISKNAHPKLLYTTRASSCDDSLSLVRTAAARSKQTSRRRVVYVDESDPLFSKRDTTVVQEFRSRRAHSRL